MDHWSQGEVIVSTGIFWKKNFCQMGILGERQCVTVQYIIPMQGGDGTRMGVGVGGGRGQIATTSPCRARKRSDVLICHQHIVFDKG